MNKPACVLLFSGGLDSLLAALMLQDLNINVICAHFISPFFGNAQKVPFWKETYKLNIEAVDIGEEFIAMLQNNPEHGFGKTLNPCVDCKILLIKKANDLLREKNADFLASGEVIGQRPMSQRRDTLHLIQNKSIGVPNLLRPLCAQLLPPTWPEINGLVDRSRLGKISGRGRNEQLEMAKRYKLSTIPAPAGGCALTDKEQARRYWRILKESHKKNTAEVVRDFAIIVNGRAFFHENEDKWLVIGRNRNDNEKIIASATLDDALVRFAHHAGPVALARKGKLWPEQLINSACSLIAGFMPHAMQTHEEICLIWDYKGQNRKISVLPNRNEMGWSLPSWEQTHAELTTFRKEQLEKKALRRQIASKKE